MRIGTLDCGGHPGVPGMPATGGSSSSAVGSSSSAVGSSSSASGSSSSGSSSTGSGGAEVGSGGGRITVDGLEGYAVLDSGGGDVKVGGAVGRGRAYGCREARGQHGTRGGCIQGCSCVRRRAAPEPCGQVQ